MAKYWKQGGKYVRKDGKYSKCPDCPCDSAPSYGDCTLPDDSLLPRQFRFTFPSSVESEMLERFPGGEPPDDEGPIDLNCSSLNGVEVILDRIEVADGSSCCRCYYGEYFYEIDCNTDVVDAYFGPVVTCDNTFNPDTVYPLGRTYGIWLAAGTAGGDGGTDSDGLVVLNVTTQHCPPPNGPPADGSCGPAAACDSPAGAATSQSFGGVQVDLSAGMGPWTFPANGTASMGRCALEGLTCTLEGIA